MPWIDPQALRQATAAETRRLRNPLGATLHATGADFAVFSGTADRVELCFYEPDDPTREAARLRMHRTECGIWRARVHGVKPGLLYGYRVDGPWDPDHGLRCDPRKLLLDPYARAIQGEAQARLDMISEPDPGHPPGSTDNGATALKAVLVDETFDWGDDRPPATPWEDTVICELHLKGFTQQHPDIPEPLRGTYAGLAHPAAISYLKDLGITAVQILPLHQHLDDGFLIDRGLTNYWGYNTIGYFAPHAAYAASQDPHGLLAEFKNLVKSLHQAGIEVILDVVYNHTAEGNEH
ncbi:MAG: glycogen debranching enzyme GlgX, partial [Verrucomicrobiales bacterium]|nr:glycogen debranching enzyme GlgX [Verrucomicrobiales bacterium]